MSFPALSRDQFLPYNVYPGTSRASGRVPGTHYQVASVHVVYPGGASMYDKSFKS